MTSERRIGREMAITSEQLGAAALPGAWVSFAKGHSVRCDTGRSALRLVLLDWVRRRTPRAVVWLPSYVCPSVGAAVAAAGLAARVYPDRPGLSDWTAPPEPTAGDIVVVVHYFGVINRAACLWLDGQPDREWGLLEDCVQAAYSAGAGLRGDYAIASLRKWWPAPDGALVCSREAIAVPHLAPPDEHFISQRVGAKLLSLNPASDATYLKWVEESELLLGGSEPRQVSWISSQMLASADPQSAALTRRSNWAVLLEGLRQHPQVRPLFDALAAGEVPLGFPVLVRAGARDALQAFLLKRQVFCPVHWKLPEAPFPEDRALSDQILTIPLDQRYASADMRVVLHDIGDFLAGSA